MGHTPRGPEAGRANETVAARRRYAPPTIRDHGTLVELTAEFDLHVAGSVMKLATLALASTPAGALAASSGEASSAGAPPASSPGVTEAGDHVTRAAGPGGSQAVLGVEGSGSEAAPGSAGAPGGAVADGTGAGSGGATREELPFTGYPAGLVAAVGAALTLTGTALRSALRRDRG